jgi:uncharacterized Zn finger protein (UPF0148 family)
MSGMLKVQSLRKSAEIHPDGKWTCPNCGTKHEHPHWEDHHQKQKVDKNFRKDWCKESDGSYELDENNIPKPIYCPKCNWKEDRLLLVKIKKGEVLTLDSRHKRSCLLTTLTSHHSLLKTR